MSKIATYSLADSPLQLSDRLIGTEAPRPTPTATPLATKNFSLGELLQLFSSNFPAASLQAVLDTNNTATEDINLTGTINTTLIKPGNIIDMLNSQGTPLQILSKGVGGICWIDGPNLSGYVPTSRELTINGVTYDLSANRSWTIGTGVQNLQEVTDEGNETTNPLIVISNNGFDENKAYIGPTFIEVSNKDIALNETTRVTLENSGIRRYNIVDGGYMLDLTDASNAVPSTETRLLKAPILTADAIIATEEWVVNNVPTLQEVTDEGATTTNSISVTDVANNKIAGINANVISVLDTITSESTAMQSEGIVFINPGASAGVLLKAATQTGNVGELLIPDVGLIPKTIAFTSDIGTWGALDYPAWTTGTPFVKMTAAGTFSLDTNTYLTSADLTGFVPYTGATQNVNLGEFELKAGQLTLDISPTGTAAVGTTRWNNSIGTSETTLKGGSVILKNGVDLVARVVNKVTPNTTLTKANYAAVRISGAQGQRLAVAYAQANNDNNSADTIGLVTETIPTNQEGFILTVGQLEDINTTGSLQGETWNDGDVLYLSPTIPGSLTNIKPSAPGHIVVIGYVEYAHNNNGKIYVKIMNGWELDELHNVAISTPLNNQALVYETSTQLWKNKTIIQDSITDGVTEIAPSQNAVFDALATKQNVLTNPITGTGANGQVAFFNGVTTQTGDNGLFWDNTNKRLGVGTITPGVTLDVNGTARVSGATTITPPALTGTSAINALDIAQTWNTTGTPTAIRLNVTNTASNANSLLMDLQVGGTSFFSVSRAGVVLASNNISGTGNISSRGNSLLTSNPYTITRNPNANTTGTLTGYDNAWGIVPTSGSLVYNAFGFTGTINQTGGANGITRGLFINPTLTSAADFRAIETTVGNVTLNTTSGNTLIGTATNIASSKLTVESTTQGVLLPRMTTAQRDAIVSPAIGLQIFNTTAGYLEYFDSFWGWMPIDNSNEWKRRNGTEYFNDFGQNNSFSDGVFQTFPLNGGGVISALPNTNNFIGFQGLSTGVLINGANSIRNNLNSGFSLFNFSCGRKSFLSRIWIQDLSTITDRFVVLNGFSNASTSTITNGAAFIYDEGGVGTGTTASANWQIITANGGVRTNFVTSVVVNASTWYSFRIETNANDTEIYYYINDILVRTETTNIPVAVTNTSIFISITKSTGTTNRGIAVDYLGLKVKLNNAR